MTSCRQAIIWTNAGILLTGPLWTNFDQILFKIYTFSFKKMYLKMSAVNRWPFCPDPNLFTSILSLSRITTTYLNIGYCHTVPQFSLVYVISMKTGYRMVVMMTSSNGNIFRVTGPLRGEFTGHRWIPLTKASDAEFWCFLWSVPE